MPGRDYSVPAHARGRSKSVVQATIEAEKQHAELNLADPGRLEALGDGAFAIIITPVRLPCAIP